MAGSHRTVIPFPEPSSSSGSWAHAHASGAGRSGWKYKLTVSHVASSISVSHTTNCTVEAGSVFLILEQQAREVKAIALIGSMTVTGVPRILDHWDFH